MGFEPTERLSRSSIFKTDALNRSLPTFHIDIVWQGLKDLNLQLLIWSQAVCQLSLSPFIFSYVCVFKMEQIAGIEPAASAWKAEVLPLYDICINWSTRPVMLGGLEITNLLFY